MNNKTLGRLKKVELRDIWQTEAGDFTPWLASEENLQLLGDTIGVDLELEAQEKSVGPFRADILCKDTADNSWVLVENQLERTNHTHLGQILTYAAGLHAVTIVWIADRFTDEHQATLEWLNEATGDEISFFGLEVELWRIADSAIAPKFNIVAKPNEWTKGGGGTARVGREELSPARVLQFEYWTEYRKYALETNTFIKPQKAHACHWHNASIGRSYFHMYAFVDTVKKRIGVRLNLGGPNAKAHFKLLEEQKEAIEADMGESLSWEYLPERKTSTISRYNENADPKDKADWATQHAYLLESFEKIHKAFSKRIKELDAGDYQPEEIEED